MTNKELKHETRSSIQPTKLLLKIKIFASFFTIYSAVSQKMDHFDLSFACSFFSKSRKSQTLVFWVGPTSHVAHDTLTLSNFTYYSFSVKMTRCCRPC
jgi:hypothetical protein